MVPGMACGIMRGCWQNAVLIRCPPVRLAFEVGAMTGRAGLGIERATRIDVAAFKLVARLRRGRPDKGKK